MPIVPGVSRNPNKDNSGEIQKPKLLLVEGNDEVIFFEQLFKKNEMLNGKSEDVQIIEIGGVEKFKTALPALINRTGFSEIVTSMAIVRDADRNFDSAFQSVCDLLTKHGLSVPSEHGTFSTDSSIKVGVFIMPGNFEGGTMLEDLCLRTKSNHPAMKCVDSFFRCLEETGIKMPSNPSKAKVQVFLAAMPKIVNNLGLGARKNYWDLNHDSLMGISNFLAEL